MTRGLRRVFRAGRWSRLWAVLVRRRLGPVGHLPGLQRRLAGPKLEVTRIDSYDSYLAYARARKDEYARRLAVESTCIGSGCGFSVTAHCYACAGAQPLFTDFAYSFETANGGRVPNWREHLRCPSCGLNNRMRAAVQLLEAESTTRGIGAVYITEQKTPLYRWVEGAHPQVEGSEYLGDAVPFGARDEEGVRNESLTRLTWDDESFDVILSFDVFEHIPDYRRALRECARVLEPQGSLLFTVPFAPDNPLNVTRARVKDDGAIEHLLPPEYHGDPLNEAGCLAFHLFGWEMLEEVRRCGFDRVQALFYWSRELGYLGLDQLAFIASGPRRPARP